MSLSMTSAAEYWFNPGRQEIVPTFVDWDLKHQTKNKQMLLSVFIL